MEQTIVFFDGQCVLCNRFVDFLIRHDKKNNFKFASLQGTAAKNILPSEYLSNVDSVVFKNKQNQIFIKSQAVVNILISLNGLWGVSKLLRIIPIFIMDFIYDLIAKNRFYWFGRRDICRISTEEEKEKILL